MKDTHLLAIHAIANGQLGAHVLQAKPLQGGHSGGNVYQVRLDAEGTQREIAIKLASVQGVAATSGDDLEGRIYAARSWSVQPVHATLRRHGIPTYDLLASGFPTPNIPFFWIAMSLLEGEPIGTLFGRAGSAEAQRLYHTAGKALGAVHAITRDYDGWVDQAEPYRTEWTDAFFHTLDRSLDTALHRWSTAGRDTLHAYDASLRAYVDQHRRQWTPPDRFVLSHMDGLQMMATRRGDEYHVIGHVDLEDFAFLDARLPLAGFELSLGIRQRRRLPPAFWDGYRTHAPVDPSFNQASDIFRLYYLLEWSWIAFDPRQHASAAAQAADVERFERAIIDLISSV